MTATLTTVTGPDDVLTVRHLTASGSNREIGRALGDLGVPMQIIEDFTSAKEVDAALRASYDV